MKKKNNFLIRGFKSLFLLAALFIFSQCNKDDDYARDINTEAPVEVAMDPSISASQLPNKLAAVTALSNTTNAIGYASVNGITTGGAGGKTITVSTLSALKTAAASSSPMIIMISGIIKGTGMITVKSNKTLIGLSGAKISGMGLSMYTVSNIIVKNLIIEYGTMSDCITIKERTHHVWIDHCTFSKPYDGLVDITQESDFVTVSWCKFIGASKGALVGGSDTSTGDKGKLNVTFHNNYFLNCIERQPSIRFGKGHVFNNYYLNNSGITGGYAIAARMGAVIRVENNSFKGIQSWPLQTIGTIHGTFCGVSTNVFSSCGYNKIATSASTWVPPYEYKSMMIATSSVASVVSAGAGAK